MVIQMKEMPCKSLETTGFLCKNGTMNSLIVTVNDELLMLTYSPSDNKKFDVSHVSPFENASSLAECEEITVKVEDIYNAKYLPIIYYTIYRLTTDSLKFYLLEQLDVSFFFILNFYPCSDFSDCKRKIEKLQGSLTYSARSLIYD